MIPAQQLKPPNKLKRALATAMGMSALFSVMDSLSKMALKHLPTHTPSVVVTV